MADLIVTIGHLDEHDEPVGPERDTSDVRWLEAVLLGVWIAGQPHGCEFRRVERLIRRHPPVGWVTQVVVGHGMQARRLRLLCPAPSGRYALANTGSQGKAGSMGRIERWIVDGLERACTATRLFEWIPGWRRVYPSCFLAHMSNRLDARWATNRWPIHDDDESEIWERWYDELPEGELAKGHWHGW